MVYLKTCENTHVEIEECPCSDHTEHVSGIDMRDYLPIERWINGVATISVRLMGDLAVLRGHIARMIRCHVGADSQLHTDGNFAILRIEL